MQEKILWMKQTLILYPELESEILERSKRTLEKILHELNATKRMKNEIRELQRFRNEHTNKTSINSHQDKTEIFCDSFFKYVDKRRCFGKHTEVIINYCFTLDDIITKVVNREKDEL